MTLAVYPVEMSQRLKLQGFSKSFLDRRVVAQPSRGRPLLRGGNSAAGGRPVTATTPPLSIDHLARFWRFFDEELDSGVSPFLIRDQQLDGTVLKDDEGTPLTDEDDTPLLMTALWVCQFTGGVPTETPLGGNYWIVSFQLLVLQS